MPKIVRIEPKDLETSCFLVQMQGLEACKNCNEKNTENCGGNKGNIKLQKKKKGGLDEKD